MEIRKAQEVLSELSAAPSKRHFVYCKRLLTSKDKVEFDPRVKEYLLLISKDDGGNVLGVNHKMDAMGWCQSKYQPEKMPEQLERFSEPNRPNRAWRRNFKSVKAELTNSLVKKRDTKLKMLKYVTNEDVIDALPRLDTNAGYSFIDTGKRYKGDYTEEILSNYSLEERNARREGSFNKPILISYRTQSKSPYDGRTGELSDKPVDKLLKSRLVSMIDVYQVLAECKFAKPFQKLLGQMSWYSGGWSNSDNRARIRESQRNYKYWTSLDYSAYDQTISDWLIREAFDVIRECFDKDSWDEELFTIIREDFIHKTFTTPWGDFHSSKGVPSGSMFTQPIDSLVNYLMIGCYMRVQDIKSYNMYIMGDDNLVFTPVELDLHDIQRYLYQEFGINMNALKAESGSKELDTNYLSKIWTKFGVYRHPANLVSKLLFPERYRQYDKYGFTPSMVVESYFEEYPVGMEQWFDRAKHERLRDKTKDEMTASKYLTGYTRYKQLYLGKAG